LLDCGDEEGEGDLLQDRRDLRHRRQVRGQGGDPEEQESLKKKMSWLDDEA
jgi:hypothetical protein